MEISFYYILFIERMFIAIAITVFINKCCFYENGVEVVTFEHYIRFGDFSENLLFHCIHIRRAEILLGLYGTFFCIVFFQIEKHILESIEATGLSLNPRINEEVISFSAPT